MLTAVLEAASFLLLLAYLLVVLDHGLLLFTRHPMAPALASRALWSTVTVHFLYLVVLTLHHGQVPAATASQALGVSAFAIAAVYGVVEWQSGEQSTGFWITGLALAAQFLAVALSGPAGPQEAPAIDLPLSATASLALLGSASLSIAAAYGTLYLARQRQLQRGRPAPLIGRLPPPEALEPMLGATVLIAFLALSGAAVAGGAAALLLQARDGGWRHPLVLFCAVSWLILAVTLAVGRRRGWRGRKAALASMAGWLALPLAIAAMISVP